MDDSRVTVEAVLDRPPSTSEQAQRSALDPKLRRMRSLHLSLVLISATALGGLAGCGNLESAPTNSRDVYANLDACKADWGNPGDCEQVDAKRSATGTSGYYGPRYSTRSGSAYGFNSTPRPGSRSSGSVTSSVTRSGFGASASRHSSGSSSHSSSSGG